MTASTAAVGSRTLADRRLDRQLAVHGFAKVRVLGAAEAERLRAAYLELRSGGGEGFDPDLNNPDVAYRQEVADLLSAELGAAVHRHFLAHEAFLWNFLCKWPETGEPLYRHRDWMFVDERRGVRSCSVWIALQDVTGHNGQLQVLPGSHRVDGALSGTDVSPPWVEADVLAPRMVAVPLEAGEALVLDHALVHASHGNHTSEPRVAVNCALRPAGEPLVHFRRDGGGGIDRYDVDAAFFVRHTPEQLLAAPPDRPVAERVVAEGEPRAVADVVLDLVSRTSLRSRVASRAARR